MQPLSDSELILNPDGSLYHLHLHPEQVAPTIITVGDPERVATVSQHFDRIEHRVQNREFVTHTGYIGTKRLTVIATGIGTDNIDIVLNELDALFNIDLATRQIKTNLTKLEFIRIGTSGCLRKELPVDTFLISKYAVGLDALMPYYSYSQDAHSEQLEAKLIHALSDTHLRPYVVTGSQSLIDALGTDIHHGITLTAPGFYAPQGRQLRARATQKDFLQTIQTVDTIPIVGLPITNLEMETAGIYGLANALGHGAISFNALLANRATGAFSTNPQRAVDGLVELVLDRIVAVFSSS